MNYINVYPGYYTKLALDLPSYPGCLSVCVSKETVPASVGKRVEEALHQLPCPAARKSAACSFSASRSHTTCCCNKNPPLASSLEPTCDAPDLAIGNGRMLSCSPQIRQCGGPGGSKQRPRRAHGGCQIVEEVAIAQSGAKASCCTTECAAYNGHTKSRKKIWSSA